MLYHTVMTLKFPLSRFACSLPSSMSRATMAACNPASRSFNATSLYVNGSALWCNRIFCLMILTVYMQWYWSSTCSKGLVLELLVLVAQAVSWVPYVGGHAGTCKVHPRRVSTVPPKWYTPAVPVSCTVVVLVVLVLLNYWYYYLPPQGAGTIPWAGGNGP